MRALIEFLKRFAPMLRSGKMSYADALTRFRAQFGRQAEGVEKAAILQEAEKAPSNVFDLTGRQIDTSKPIMGGKNVVETEKGFTPTVVSNKRAEFLKKYTKDGQPNNVELNALANEHRILSAEAKKLGDAGENYEKFSQLNKRTEEIEEILDFMNKEFPPEGMASGGLARVGMFSGGQIPKGLMALLKGIQKKFGKKALYKGDEVVIDNKIFKRSNKKRPMTADELEDFEMDIGDALEGYDFDGTVGSAERILKEQKAYEAAMYRDYKAGRLDPKPGEPNRKRFLEKKLEEMELSGDKRLMTRDEIEELSSFDLGTEMDEAIKKSKQKDIKQKRVLEEFDPTGRKKNASGGLAHILGV